MDFYFVNPTYVQFLKSIDSKVPDIRDEKRNKFLCGVVLDVHGEKFFSPISSFDKPQKTNFLILDQNGKTISSLRLSFMLPVLEDQLTPYLIEEEPDAKYKSLLRQELAYIRAHEAKIEKKAAQVYAIGKNQKHFLSKNCCDFAKLEREATSVGFAKFLAFSAAKKSTSLDF